MILLEIRRDEQAVARPRRGVRGEEDGRRMCEHGPHFHRAVVRPRAVWRKPLPVRTARCGGADGRADESSLGDMATAVAQPPLGPPPPDFLRTSGLLASPP